MIVPLHEITLKTSVSSQFLSTLLNSQMETSLSVLFLEEHYKLANKVLKLLEAQS